MFILELTYTAPLDRIDALLEEHVAWLDRGYAEGVFVASGRKNPRDGGIIIAVGVDRRAVEARAATDPFAVEGVAEYRVVEFVPTKTAAGLEGYRETLPV
ncbi:MAG TPA: YciI family protein [Oryzihumus sp.]|nr:YciI family protein [Oryzihumus sp.]